MIIATICARCGVTVQIDDRYIVQAGSDHEKRVISEQRLAARHILNEHTQEEKSA